MIVADANVIVELLTPAAHTATIESLWKADADWVAPLFWRSEFVSTVWQKLRAGQIDPRTIGELFGHMDEVVKRSYAVDPRTVLDVAMKAKHSPYDCEYVVLARSLRVKLCTLDQPVLERFPDVARTPKRLLDELRAD